MNGALKTTDISDSPAGTSILTDMRASGDAAGPGAELGSLPARARRRVSTQTLILALVLTASAGSLYMMRRQGMGAGINFKTMQVKIEADLDNLRPPSSAAQQRILDDLDRSTSPMQTALEHLQKNPFVLPNTESAPEKGVPNAGDLARLQREADIKAALATIQLNGIMLGPVPLARLNTKLVHVGDRIEKFFIVAQIHDRSVELIADGQTYTLNMGEGSANPTRPNPRAPAGPPRR